MKTKLKAGVLGIRRGSSFALSFDKHPATELEAVCDLDKTAISDFLGGRKDVAVYDDYDRFLEHDLDIIAVCNYCTEHAPFAIKALDAGKHVLSEIIACKTLAQLPQFGG